MGAGAQAGPPPGTNFTPNTPSVPGAAPWWENIGKAMNKSSAQVRTNAELWMTNAKTQAKHWKPPKGMPVHVEMDFLNPFAETVRTTASNLWMQVPLPVQQALPFVAVGATAGIVIFKHQNSRLKHEQAKSERLEGEVASLLTERSELQEKVKELRVKSLAPRSASEMKMAAAVAEATSAAAAAASAAAQAASHCAVRRSSANQDYKVGPRQ